MRMFTQEQRDKIAQHENALADIEKELEARAFVDVNELAKKKNVYMVSSRLLDTEIHYSGLSHSRHGYRDYFVKGYNVMNKGASESRVKFGSSGEPLSSSPWES